MLKIEEIPVNKYNFWESWNNKTEIEEQAIEKLKLARDKIIKAIPKDQLVAIYVKGSFTRREMKDGSDVDMVPIVKDDKFQATVFGVNGPEIDPVCAVPLSVGEFEDNQLHTKFDLPVDLRAKPDIFLKMLDECKLIYGQPLVSTDYPIRSNREVLSDEINVIKNGYIPYYEQGKIDFDPLLKEVFWLVEAELSLKGKTIEHSFEGIAKAVSDSDHIIHDAYRLRKKQTKESKLKFIKKLKAYLDTIKYK